jgi:tetratricopeptide (TPR) repeat protein
LEKGLDEDGEKEAKTLAASALYEQAEQLMIRIRRQRDPTFFRNEAVKKLKEAVELDPELGEGWLLIAKLNAIPGGDPDEALSALDQAIGQLDDEAVKQSEAYYLRSMLTRKDDREGAREDLDKAIEINESNVQALRIRSRLQILEGDVEEGLEDSNKILELNEGNVKVWMAQGASLSQLAKLQEDAAVVARNAEENGDDDAGNDVDSQFPQLSAEELESGAKAVRESVLDLYTKLLEVAPENENVYMQKAAAHQLLDQDEEAMATIDSLIEKDDSSIMALQMKARLLLSDEDNDEKTVEVLDRALKLDPYDTATRDLRMRFFMAREQYPNAIAEAKKILEKEPDSIGVMDRLGLLYTLDEQPDKAVEMYGEILRRMSPSYIGQLPPRSRPIFLMQRINYLRSRGDAFLSTGEHENAIEDYDEALDLGDQIEEMQASISGQDFEYTPNDGVLNNLAWVLATSTNDDLRNGKRAIELARRACEVTEYKMPHILSTLASGYAEDGDFEEAIKWIEKGLEVNEAREIDEVVTEEEKERQRKSLEKELESYRQKKPWRENQAEEEAAKKEAEAKDKEEPEDEEDSDKDSDDDAEDEDK